MTFSCKGVCDRYKATLKGFGLKYANGIYRCRTCNIYLAINGVKFGKARTCVCCGQLVSSKPKDHTCREKYNKEFGMAYA